MEDKSKLKLLHEPASEFEHRNDVFFVGGMVNCLSQFDLAIFYKESADLLLDNALKEKDLSYQYSYPTIYLYRHAIELGLKSIYPKSYWKHNLQVLINNLRDEVVNKYGEKVPDYFLRWLRDLNQIDPSSVGFRYGNVECDEYIISYHNLRDIVEEIFRVIKILKKVKW